MRKFQPGQRPFNQFGNKFLRADFHKLLGFDDQIGFSHGSVNAQDPTRGSEATLILDGASVKVPFGLPERNDDGLRWHHNFQMPTNVVVELLETVIEVSMVISR